MRERAMACMRGVRVRVLVLGLVALVFAKSPTIEFNKTVCECGTIVDGTKDKLYATFTFKNTGDSTLRLLKVKPGCLCTAVDFDSVILPGKSSRIDATVDLSTYHSGTINKPITVTSNATNTPRVVLVVRATIQSIIAVSQYFIIMDASKPGTNQTIFLSTLKRDLSVSSVTFYQNMTNNTQWEKAIPISISFAWQPLDSIRSDGYRVFRLTLTTPDTPEPLRGKLQVKTNHPDKPELWLQCIINKE